MKGTKLVHIDEDSGRVVIRPKSQLSKILRRDTLNVFITATHLSKKDGASYGISVLPFTLFNPKLASHFVNEYLYNPILKNNPAIYDGVILSESTLPGVPGNMDPLINRGRTLVHEVIIDQRVLNAICTKMTPFRNLQLGGSLAGSSSCV